MARTRVPGPLLQAIGAVTAWLRSADVPAAVIGGVAASLLGRPRVTKDVDLVVALTADSDLPRFLALGERHGVTPRTADAVDFAKVSRVLLLRHGPSGIEIDMSLASLPFEQEVIERAVERTIRGVAFRLATVEDLIVMKAIALRPRDIADIEALLDTHPQLDVERIRGYLRAFTEALETDDFAAEFERLLVRQQRRQQPGIAGRPSWSAAESNRALHDVICAAIRDCELLEFDYDGLHRVVAPYCHGFTGENEVLRAIQVGGQSHSRGMGFGKLWTVDKMLSVRRTGNAFVPDDPHYSPNDSAMAAIHCRVRP